MRITSFKFLSSITPVASIAGTAAVVICDLIAINHNPGYNPMQQSISSMVYYPWGWLETAAMGTSALMQALIAGLILSAALTKTSFRLRLAGIMFAVISLGSIIIMVFQTDPAGTVATLARSIHVTTVITISILFPMACLLVAWAIAKQPQSTTIINYSVIMASISLVIAWQVLPFNDVKLVGLNERLLAGINLAWIVFAAWRLPVLLESNRSVYKVH
ncbi:hypothetical protein DGWBC_0556 [Dehalogenimonas sp. WBC-2]|nr:hypothetical protein DGWBC_0556 [Dehalogenimonas sp. WBC-2]